MTEEAFRNIGHVIKHRGTDPRYKDRLFMYFEDERLTFGDYLSSCIRYANLFLKVKTEKKPDCFNVGVLMQNYPEFMISLGACALAGATLSGINTGQKGLMLARDINFTDCILLITDNMFLPEVEAVIDDLSLIDRKNVVVNNIRDEDKSLPHGYTSLDNKLTETEAVMGTRAFNTAPDIDVDPETNLMIIFTSGTTGSPKGIINSHQKLMGMSAGLIAGLNFSDNDVAYGVMPHFHSNSVYLAYIPAIMCAGGFAFRRKFSASGFLPDIKKFGVTTFNYVGKPLAYILAATKDLVDHDNRLRMAIGNGASAVEQNTFRERFGLDWVMEVFGSTEGGATVIRMPGDPDGSVGVMAPDLKLIREEDGEETEPAQVDEDGLLTNYGQAVGEIINTGGLGNFEGYYKNEEATHKKAKGGMFHTGDLAYYRLGEKDGQPVRFMYFVGRTGDWIRKDGENFLSEPIEDIINGYACVFLSVVYGVPCHQADELVMVSLKLNQGEEFDPQGFYNFITTHEGMNEKWWPDFVRVLEELPHTETVKINPTDLRRKFYNMEHLTDSLFWRERGDMTFKPFSLEDYQTLKSKFVEAGRTNELVRE
jgi:fatty-acyl-CoA synthase